MTERHGVHSPQLDVTSDNCGACESRVLNASMTNNVGTGRRVAVVVFKVNVAETCAGESIKVVGSHPGLGAWSVSEGVPLTTDSLLYPSWRATVLLEAPSDSVNKFSVEYKYVRDRRALDVKPGLEFVWEEGVDNRRVTISVDHPFKENVVQDYYLGERVCSLRPVFSSRGRKHRSLKHDAPIHCKGSFDEAYEITDFCPVAVGASAKIYWCNSKCLATQYAVKFIDRTSLTKDEKKNLFGIRNRQGEIELHAQLKHPNILRLVEVLVDPEKVSLVLEPCYGGDLHDCIKKQRILSGGGFPELVAAACLQQLLKALEFLHAGGIVHRDVKSENILVLENSDSLEDCNMKLGDFGFAACLHQTKTGFLRTVMGSPNYVAPEVIRGQPYATGVDMWSAGVVLHHLLVGHLPFRARSPKATLKKVQVGIFNTSGGAWNGIGKNAKDALLSLMSYEMSLRWRAAQALGHTFFMSAGKSGETTAAESVSSVGRASTMCASDERDVDSLCDTEFGASDKQLQDIAQKSPIGRHLPPLSMTDQSALDSEMQIAREKDMQHCFTLSEASSSDSSLGSASARRNDVADAIDQMLQDCSSPSSSDEDDEDDHSALEPFIYTKRTSRDDGEEKPRACFASGSDSSGLSTALWAVMQYVRG